MDATKKSGGFSFVLKCSRCHGRMDCLSVDGAIFGKLWEACFGSWRWSNLWQVGGGFKYFLNFFTLIFGEMIQFDEHIFQMGWFDHQLVVVGGETSHIFLFAFSTPSLLGEMMIELIQFDYDIFFRWVGEKPPTIVVFLLEISSNL